MSAINSIKKIVIGWNQNNQHIFSETSLNQNCEDKDLFQMTK